MNDPGYTSVCLFKMKLAKSHRSLLYCVVVFLLRYTQRCLQKSLWMEVIYSIVDLGNEYHRGRSLQLIVEIIYY